MAKYCKINLAKTNYSISPFALPMPLLERSQQINVIKGIYKKYSDYKKFESVMPLFDIVILDRTHDIIGYHRNGNLVAFTILKIYDEENVESVQFAWDYENPKLRMGILSIEHECAYYKSLGYKNLYLGLKDVYKTKFDGYEELGKLE